jgi:putative nucleotidyltransferase with HDIG domain
LGTMSRNREEAWKLLTEHTRSDSLLKHALAVEAAMRAYARRFGEDEETWGVVGLLHDFDYEEHPDPAEHPFVGARILTDLGYPEEIVRAVLAHGNHTGVERRTTMEKALFAVDELCGFLTAVALVRPGKAIAEVPVSSVKKKLKDKAFARSVNREEILQGAAELGVDLDGHIRFTLDSLIPVARELGLPGDE